MRNQLGIYFHVPFCKKACTYCDFHFSTQLNKVSELMEAIELELEWHFKTQDCQPLRSVYFGGGTPSVVDPKYLSGFVQNLDKSLGWHGNPEITIEVNPDDVTIDRIKEWKSIGINRISIGVQSFDDYVLKWMNRAHNSQEADRAIKCLQDADLTNISMDMIYGHGMNSDLEWEADIEKFISYQTPHLSAYALTIEEKTALSHFTEQQQYVPMDDDRVVAQFLYLHQQLTEIGMDHYELSNFATQDHVSQHNSSYWSGAPFWGLGPSAHGYNGRDRRKINVSNNALYAKGWRNGGEGVYQWEELSNIQMSNEFWMTGLRTAKGVNLDEWKSKFQLELPKDFEATLDKWKRNHSLTLKENTLSCTPSGWMLMDAILSDLFLTETNY
jgi:oxygen-independent coproporphyrinogen-3 oxidase